MLTALRGCRVLLTGHTGFKGAWLSLWLHHLGARIHGYALAPDTTPSAFEVAGVADVLEGHHVGDVRDYDRLCGVVTEAAPQVVIHMAAQALVRRSYQSPRETFDVNVMGTVNLLEAVRAMGRPCAVVVVSSDKCYENREQVWGYRENDAMGGFDPYSASKGCTELVVASLRRSFFPPSRLAEHGVSVASARAGNVIGGGDWAEDRIVADFARAMAGGRPVEVRQPQAVRPWQHVLEPLSGYLTLAAAMHHEPRTALCDGWNFGPMPGTERTVAELVDHVVAAWNEALPPATPAARWVDVSQPHALHEAQILRLCIDKAMAGLGWAPRWTLAETTRRLARWYQRHAAGDTDMRAACLEDIAAYEAATPLTSS